MNINLNITPFDNYYTEKSIDSKILPLLMPTKEILKLRFLHHIFSVYVYIYIINHP